MILVTIQGQKRLVRKELIREIEAADDEAVLRFSDHEYIRVEESVQQVHETSDFD